MEKPPVLEDLRLGQFLRSTMRAKGFMDLARKRPPTQAALSPSIAALAPSMARDRRPHDVAHSETKNHRKQQFNHGITPRYLLRPAQAECFAKAETVLIHFCDRPLARMTFSSDERPIVRSRLFVGPGSKPDGLCAFRQSIRLHPIDVINWRPHSCS